MNCPGHIQIFRANLHSYRELPLRYGEFGQCHRNEPSGSLHGMMRVRGFTQGRWPYFFVPKIRYSTNAWRSRRCCKKVYADFGFTEIIYKVATRPENRVGSDEVWDKAETALIESLKRSGCEFEISPGEGGIFTARRSNIPSRTPLADLGNVARFRQIFPCRYGSAQNMSQKTIPAKCRSCSTAQSWDRWNDLSEC